REALDVFLTAEGGERLVPFGEYVLRFQPALGEDGAVLLRFLGGVAPARLDGLGLIELDERESLLALSVALVLAEQHGLHQRLAQRVSVIRQRNEHAELLTDLFGLAKDDLEHRAI